MGSNLNFKNMGDVPPESSGGSGRPPGGGGNSNFSLARQTSIYSLTFDEFQNTMGGLGKDFGSMNMDEFLRSVWTAEEAQAMGMTSSFQPGGVEGGGGGGGLPNANLQRQGSLTLPRTLSQKTVDEVWKDLFKENGGSSKENVNVNGGSSLQQRQQTLGEMTLEEFLVRAGVVREDPPPVVRPPNNNGFYGELLQTTNNNPSLALGFGQPNRTNGLMNNHRVVESTNHLSNQSPSLALNVNGNRSSQHQHQQQQHHQHHQHQQQQQQQLQQIFPKQPTVTYASPLHLGNNFGNNGQLASPGMRGGVVGLGDHLMNNGLVQGGGIQGGGVGMGGLGAGAVTIATVSPANRPSSDGLGKSNGDTSSLSPVPYVFNGSLRGKRSGAVEKVVERRQRRMIKNRESAARSRARKQAYTMELEAEVQKLKEENEELQKKQTVIKELQEKNQVLEKMNQQPESKRRCLRRTQTGPW